MTENKIKYTVWDVETTIKSSYKRKGNPFDPENFVVMSGYRRNGGEVVGEYFGIMKRPADYFTKLLIGTTVLVGQNIKFDLLSALNDTQHGEANRIAWMAYIGRGGMLWDIQLAEYLLNGMTIDEHMLSLDELAPRYGGNVKIDEVKALWEAGVNTPDIDPDLLRDYLCGRVDLETGATEEGDIGNTELVWLGQYERAKAAGQVKSILMNMGSLVCTNEMELNGMAVDKELGLVLSAELAEEIALLSLEVNQYLPEGLPFDFNWNSGQQKSALIFGGTVKYKKWLPHLTEDGRMQYAMKDEVHVVMDDGTTTSLDTYLNDVAQLDHDKFQWPGPIPVRYGSGKNAGELKTKKVKVPNLDKPKGAIQDVPYTFPGYTQPSMIWATATEGVYSTGAEVIEALGNRDIPFLKALSKITALRKDLTTYFITEDKDGNLTGMLTLVQADGIIHHMLNHTSTVTGRFSSSSPNLQNIPKGNKSKAKSLFISRFPGGYIIQSDFSSLEVYVQAILTGCKQLIQDLIEGLDMHCKRVSQKEGITYEEAVKLCKGYVSEHGWVDAIKEWDIKRTKAKIFSFQRAFGAGAETISTKGGMPKEDVEKLIEAERAMYPETETFFDKVLLQLDARKQPTGIFVQHPELPGVTCNLSSSWYRTPDNKLYKWRESPAPGWLAKRSRERGGKLTSFSPTEVKNYPVQGSGGEWAKAAMWLAVRAFYARSNFDGKALLVNQVHDAIYIDCHPDVYLEAAALLHACMEEASTFMEYYFGWIIPVHVPSDTKMGHSMIEENVMPEGFKELVLVERKKLRAAYMNGYSPKFGNQLENV